MVVRLARVLDQLHLRSNNNNKKEYCQPPPTAKDFEKTRHGSNVTIVARWEDAHDSMIQTARHMKISQEAAWLL